MKPTCSNFENRANVSFVELPPAGVYVGQIMAVLVIDADGQKVLRDFIELMVEITEGEYKGRFTEAYNDQKTRLGEDKAKYKGIFRLIPPIDSDDDWRFRVFKRNVDAVMDSNPGFNFYKPDGSWDEQGLAGKTVGINIRNRIYNFTTSEGEVMEGKTIEIAEFDSVQSVREGKVRVAKDRDARKTKDTSSVPTGYTQVNTELPPWG